VKGEDLKMPSVGELRINRSSEGPSHTLLLRGELDLVTAPEVEDIVASLCLAKAREITLDLRQVVFMDSSGLRTILAAMDMCRVHGCEFMLVPGDGPCRRLFEITGVLDDLPIREADELAEPPAHPA
jgi:anti-anti-sigma factor